MLYRHLFSGFIITILIAVAWLETHIGDKNLAEYIRKNGHIVIAPGQNKTDPDFQDNNLQNLIDGDYESPIYIKYPAELNEPTYFLVDLGLSHWSGQNINALPSIRKSISLEITNGSCLKCTLQKFKGTARLKKIRVDILYRRANNVDQDFEFPPVQTVFTKFATFEDKPGTTTIDLSKMKHPAKSRKWPENMFYIIAKIVILEIYPGHNDSRVAISELSYLDAPILKKKDDQKK